MFPRRVDLIASQQFHDARRGAGFKHRHPDHQATDVKGMETVDILERRYRFDHLLGIDMPGQGHLHQDAVVAGIAVQRIDLRQQFRLRDSGGMFAGQRADPDLLTGASLAAHVNFRGGVLPHQDHRQPRRAPGGQCGNGGLNLGTDLRRHRLAVDQLRFH